MGILLPLKVEMTAALLAAIKKSIPLWKETNGASIFRDPPCRSSLCASCSAIEGALSRNSGIYGELRKYRSQGVVSSEKWEWGQVVPDLLGGDQGGGSLREGPVEPAQVGPEVGVGVGGEVPGEEGIRGLLIECAMKSREIAKAGQITI